MQINNGNDDVLKIDTFLDLNIISSHVTVFTNGDFLRLLSLFSPVISFLLVEFSS